VTITLALVGSILYYGYSGKFNGHSGTVSAVGTSEVAAPQTGPVAAPAADPTLPKPVCVAKFLPDQYTLYRTANSTVDTILSLPMDPNDVLLVDRAGNVVNSAGSVGPRVDVPGVLEWQNGSDSWARSWPGTDLGTAQINGHTQRGTDLQFTPLLERLSVGTAQYADGSYRIKLRGPSGQVLNYAIREVAIIPTGDHNTARPDLRLYENDPNRLLTSYCNDPGKTDVWIVADLIREESAGSC